MWNCISQPPYSGLSNKAQSTPETTTIKKKKKCSRIWSVLYRVSLWHCGGFSEQVTEYMSNWITEYAMPLSEKEPPAAEKPRITILYVSPVVSEKILLLLLAWSVTKTPSVELQGHQGRLQHEMDTSFTEASPESRKYHSNSSCTLTRCSVMYDPCLTTGWRILAVKNIMSQAGPVLTLGVPSSSSRLLDFLLCGGPCLVCHSF